MLNMTIIGHLGADAQVVEKDGRRFASCRVASTETWTGADGVRHEQTQWIDIICDPEKKVIQYLKKGTLIYAQGTFRTRVYSSEKDRCMKTGITLRAYAIMLLNSQKSTEQPTGEEVKDAPF